MFNLNFKWHKNVTVTKLKKNNNNNNNRIDCNKSNNNKKGKKKNNELTLLLVNCSSDGLNPQIAFYFIEKKITKYNDNKNINI